MGFSLLNKAIRKHHESFHLENEISLFDEKTERDFLQVGDWMI